MISINRKLVMVICIGLLVAGIIGSATAQEIKIPVKGVLHVQKDSEARFSVTVDPRI